MNLYLYSSNREPEPFISVEAICKVWSVAGQSDIFVEQGPGAIITIEVVSNVPSIISEYRQDEISNNM